MCFLEVDQAAGELEQLCLDRGYDSPPMHRLACAHGYTPHIRARGEEIKLKARTPGWRARRWVVEAIHSWLNRNRGILIRWCKKDENHLALQPMLSSSVAGQLPRSSRPESGSLPDLPG